MRALRGVRRARCQTNPRPAFSRTRSLYFDAAPGRGEVDGLGDFAFGVLVFDDQRVRERFRATWQISDCTSSIMRLVIAVRLIGLEHGEFGVVLAREAFVAEVAADLEHLVDAADEQALEIKLERDAQIKIAAERVVMRDERLRRRAAGNGLHHRRLDFHEAARRGRNCGSRE